MRPKTGDKPRVVIVGAGFAGLSAAQRLAARRDVETVMVDRNNYHTFLPLLYQVAAAELDAADVANPLRGLFRRRPNVSIIMGEVVGLDLEKRILHTNAQEIDYDYLVLALGSRSNFFGTPGAAEFAFTLKSLEDATKLRNHLLNRFEQAALLAGREESARQEMLTHITVVGGGPAGIEYAGALAELIRCTLHRDFPELPRGMARVTLLEASEHILPGFPPKLCDYTIKRLQRMGVTVRLKAQVTEVREESVLLADGSALSSATMVWTAGACGGRVVAEMGLPVGRGGRIAVLSTLQVAEHPEVFVVGDLSLPEGVNAPMVAPNAMQQGRSAADNILNLIRRQPLKPFVYRDKGSLAVIGRNAAVAHVGGFEFTGFMAWILWLVVHLSYLIGFHNRLMVMIGWAWDYFFAERSVRLIIPKRDVSPHGRDEKNHCESE